MKKVRRFYYVDTIQSMTMPDNIYLIALMRRICSELLMKNINNQIMTRSDEMMLSAIRLKVAMQMNGRDVTVEGDCVKVSLHGVPALVVRFDSGDVRVNGMLKVSR